MINSKVKKLRYFLNKLKLHTGTGKAANPLEVKWSVGDWYLKDTADPVLHELHKWIYEKFEYTDVYEVQHVIQEILGHEVISGGEMSEKEIAVKVLKLEGEVDNWEQCIAVYALDIEEEFSFGSAVFKPGSMHTPVSNPSDQTESTEANVFSWCCVEAKGTAIYSEDVAEVIINEHISSLVFLHHYLDLRYASDTVVRTTLTGSQEKSSKLSRRMAGGGFGGHTSTNHNGSVLTVTKDQVLRWRRETIFQKLELLLKNSEGKLETKVKIALSFYLDSAAEKQPDIKVLKAVIGIEALLGIKKEGNISQSLAEKSALLLSKDLAERMVIIDEIKSLYDYRSVIGHGGEGKYDFITAIEAQEYLARLLGAFLKKYQEVDGFTNIEDINDWYIKLKMS